MQSYSSPFPSKLWQPMQPLNYIPFDHSWFCNVGQGARGATALPGSLSEAACSRSRGQCLRSCENCPCYSKCRSWNAKRASVLVRASTYYFSKAPCSRKLAPSLATARPRSAPAAPEWCGLVGIGAKDFRSGWGNCTLRTLYHRLQRQLKLDEGKGNF